jgi:hypothetical protein
VGRKRDREQIIAATKPSLASGEHIRSCTAVLATECSGRGPLLFRERARHYLALTDQRLILFREPRRHHQLTSEELLIAKRHSSFTIVKTRRFAPLMQVRIRDAADREIALQFRPRDRHVGRELVTVLGGTAVVQELRRIERRGTFARQIRPIADEIARMLPEVAPWTARPAFDRALQSLAWVEAQVALLRGWVDEHGIIGEDGQLRPAVSLLERLETQASTLRAELGLTPQALARLLSSLASVATAGADEGGLAALEAEGQRIISARHGELGPVDAEEASHSGAQAAVPANGRIPPP